MAGNLKNIWGQNNADVVTCGWRFCCLTGGGWGEAPEATVTIVDGDIVSIAGVGTGLVNMINNGYDGNDPYSVCSSGYNTVTGNYHETIKAEWTPSGTGLFEIKNVSIAMLAAFVLIVILWAAYRHLKHMIGVLSSPDDEDDPLLRWEDDDGRERWQMKNRTKWRMDQ